MSVSANNHNSESQGDTRRSFMKKMATAVLTPNTSNSKIQEQAVNLTESETENDRDNGSNEEDNFRGFLLSRRPEHSLTGSNEENYIGVEKLFLQPLGERYDYHEGDYMEIPIEVIDHDPVFENLYEDIEILKRSSEKTLEATAELTGIPASQPHKIVNNLYERAETVQKEYEKRTNSEREEDSYTYSIEEWMQTGY